MHEDKHHHKVDIRVLICDGSVWGRSCSSKGGFVIPHMTATRKPNRLNHAQRNLIILCYPA